MNETDPSFIWVHIGDLHITSAEEANYRDLRAIVATLNQYLLDVDFCVLPGDNANEGTPEQYALIRSALGPLRLPLHVIPGDHDFVPGNLLAFYRGLDTHLLPYSEVVGGCRCLFLDVVSRGKGGPDFALGDAQLRWLRSELQLAERLRQPCALFMHAYPADLSFDRHALLELLSAHPVRLVDMGHTHYNELANDGRTVFATTRSTGQIEEGPVGFSIGSLYGGHVSWRFKPLQSGWPFVMICAPADTRLLSDAERIASSRPVPLAVIAHTWGDAPVSECRCRIDEGSWVPMQSRVRDAQWEIQLPDVPDEPFGLTVEALDAAGRSGSDRIRVAGVGEPVPRRAGNGSDEDSVGAWPERHLLGTRLGPNRNGRRW